MLPSTGPDAGVPTAHWAELDVRDPAHATLVDQGDISGAQIDAGVGMFDSSIAVDRNGDVLINFTASGPSIAPTDDYVVHTAGTPDGEFSAPTEYKTSVVPFVDPHAASFGTTFPVSRWGDYSSAVADPQNSNGFGISGEYGTTPGSYQWGTAIAHVIVGPNAGELVASNHVDEQISAVRGLDAPTISFVHAPEEVGDASRHNGDPAAHAGMNARWFTSGGLDLGGEHPERGYASSTPLSAAASGTMFQPEHGFVLEMPDAITQG